MGSENQITFSSLEFRQTTDGLRIAASVERNKVCICNADLKGEAFPSYQDQREEFVVGMRRAEPIGSASWILHVT